MRQRVAALAQMGPYRLACTVKIVDGPCRFETRQFARRARPRVVVRACDVKWAWGDEGQDDMLVGRQRRFAARKIAQGGGKPMREAREQVADRLAFAPTEGPRTARTRVVRDGTGDARVARGGPQGRFAVARMADRDRLVGRDKAALRECVQYQRKAPGPKRDRTRRRRVFLSAFGA